ncbi:zinc finger, CCHC-type containing protein, partial [Tanacetum coccineum]
AVVRLPDPKRKTLGEKESRDSIFDENRFSLISRPKDIMPNLEESQRDDHSDDVPSEIPKPRKGFRQKEGIDYFDTYAPVARITIIRLLLALAAIHNLVIHQMDVKTTFLNGNLDEKVSMKQPEGFVMPGNEHKKIIKKFNHEDCSPVNTPLDLVEKLKPNTVKSVDQLEYSRAIVCLLYAMTSTRPDIAYVVGRLRKDIKVKKSKNEQKPTRNEETSTRERFEANIESRIKTVVEKSQESKEKDKGKMTILPLQWKIKRLKYPLGPSTPFGSQKPNSKPISCFKELQGPEMSILKHHLYTTLWKKETQGLVMQLT